MVYSTSRASQEREVSVADIDCFMWAIRQQESGGNYGAYNPGSGAAGAYQFEPGTWQSALWNAGLGGWINQYPTAHNAPPWLQDAAARSLMGNYFNAFRSWFSVAEAWYGGPGAVGHPEWGGGPGYPTVGQYASQVMALYAQCGGTAPPSVAPPFRLDLNGAPEWRYMNEVWGLVSWIYSDGIPADEVRTWNAAWW